MKKPILKTLRIKNFKSHKDLKINLANRTEIYGKNAVGKTSVAEAIRFIFYPKKSDKDKVAVGCEKAEVFFEFDLEGKDGKTSHATVKSWVNKEGVHNRSVQFDGIAPQNPALFLKQFISFGTFNPREMVAKEGRTERLLSLLPLSVKEEDFKDFDLHQKDEIDWNAHAFTVLRQVERDLRNTKLNLYQKSDMLKKHYLKYDDDLAKKKLEYENNFPNKLQKSYEEIIKGEGAEEKKAEYLKDFLVGTEKQIREQSNLLDITESNLSNEKQKLARLEQEVKTLKKSIEEKTKTVPLLKDKIKSFQQTKEETQKKISSLDTEKEKRINQLTQASEEKAIKHLEKDLQKYKEEAEEAKLLHDKHYESITKTLPALRSKILAPLKKEIPGFDISENNYFIDGKSFDELSESETLALSIRFQTIENKTGFILVDCAEALTPETIKGIKWPKNAILFRVAKQPLKIDDWKSIEILEGGKNEKI